MASYNNIGDMWHRDTRHDMFGWDVGNQEPIQDVLRNMSQRRYGDCAESRPYNNSSYKVGGISQRHPMYPADNASDEYKTEFVYSSHHGIPLPVYAQDRYNVGHYTTSKLENVVYRDFKASRYYRQPPPQPDSYRPTFPQYRRGAPRVQRGRQQNCDYQSEHSLHRQNTRYRDEHRTSTRPDLYYKQSPKERRAMTKSATTLSSCKTLSATHTQTFKKTLKRRDQDGDEQAKKRKWKNKDERSDGMSREQDVEVKEDEGNENPHLENKDNTQRDYDTGVPNNTYPKTFYKKLTSKLHRVAKKLCHSRNCDDSESENEISRPRKRQHVSYNLTTSSLSSDSDCEKSSGSSSGREAKVKLPLSRRQLGGKLSASVHGQQCTEAGEGDSPIEMRGKRQLRRRRRTADDGSPTGTKPRGKGESPIAVGDVTDHMVSRNDSDTPSSGVSEMMAPPPQPAYLQNTDKMKNRVKSKKKAHGSILHKVRSLTEANTQGHGGKNARQSDEVTTKERVNQGGQSTFHQEETADKMKAPKVAAMPKIRKRVESTPNITTTTNVDDCTASTCGCEPHTSPAGFEPSCIVPAVCDFLNKNLGSADASTSYTSSLCAKRNVENETCLDIAYTNQIHQTDSCSSNAFSPKDHCLPGQFFLDYTNGIETISFQNMDNLWKTMFTNPWSDPNHCRPTEPQHMPDTAAPNTASPKVSSADESIGRVDRSQCYSSDLKSLLKSWSECMVCAKPFNNSVICSNYSITFNQPIQYNCGCVVCTQCQINPNHMKCKIHKNKLTRGFVNSTANAIAHWRHVYTKVPWSMELAENHDGPVEQNKDAQVLLDGNIDDNALLKVFTTLLEAKVHVSFKYGQGQVMKISDAHKYVAIPHTRCFWDHIATSTRKPNTSEMMAPDSHLCKLFNVLTMNDYTFHWACFVFTSEVVLAMWCVNTVSNMHLALTDKKLVSMTEADEFRLMTYFLHKWVCYHYEDRDVHVVLDSKPCETLRFPDLIKWMAVKCGMNTLLPLNSAILPVQSHVAPVDSRKAEVFFIYPREIGDNCTKIDIGQTFDSHHEIIRYATCKGYPNICSTFAHK